MYINSKIPIKIGVYRYVVRARGSGMAWSIYTLDMHLFQ